MKILRVPLKLRLTTLMLMLAIPFVALQTIIAARAPWWDLPIKSIQIWAAAVGMISFPLAIWIAHGKKWAFRVTYVFATIWCLLSVMLAIHLGHFWLNVFVLFLILFWIIVLSKLKIEMERSYLDPNMAWYQGLPETIPGIVCEFKTPNKIYSARVSRFDEDGTFVVFSETVELSPRHKNQYELSFFSDEKKVQCQGKLIRALDQFKGLGIQFVNLTPDQKKQAGDFVEWLRGKGYVA